MVNCLPLSPHPLHPHKKDHLAVRAGQTDGCCLNLEGGKKFTAQAYQLNIRQGTQAEVRQLKDRHKIICSSAEENIWGCCCLCLNFGLGVSQAERAQRYTCEWAEDTNMAGDEDKLPRQKFLRNRVDMTVFLEKEIICMLFKNVFLVLKLFCR